MPLSSLFASLSPTSLRLRTLSVCLRRRSCLHVASHMNNSITHLRRSANYKPTIWDYQFIQSLNTRHSQSQESLSDIKRVKQLKEEVKTLLDEDADPLCQLELIDDLERLGLSYHFEHDIDTVLKRIHNDFDHHKYWEDKGLHASALAFRIFRQHGHNVPQGFFTGFMDESIGEFKECFSEDTKGLLSLYEASYLSMEGEIILKKARDFATKHLREHVHKQNQDDRETSLVTIRHALELPLHWRVPRLESRWFIDIYETRHDKNHSLLQLAKLDFNIVQASHQEDLKHGSRWWRSTCFVEKLTFSRDRLVENFLWTVGLAYEPRFEYTRRMMTKVNSLITTIDDIYDVYGTLDELKLFTNAVKRWDLEAMNGLPNYMQICYFSLYNSTNEIAFDAMKKHGVNIVIYLKNAWADLCKAYLLEAEWYYSGYTPTLQEYLDNAWISISAPLTSVLVYFFVIDRVTIEGMACLEPSVYCNMIRWPSMILRLADDLGTSLEELQRGDVPKSIQCYMRESGASEEDAREHIRQMIGEMWDKMNKEHASNSLFCRDFVRIIMNLARMSQCMYQYGDGHASQDKVTQDRVSKILIQSITL